MDREKRNQSHIQVSNMETVASKQPLMVEKLKVKGGVVVYVQRQNNEAPRAKSCLTSV